MPLEPPQVQASSMGFPVTSLQPPEPSVFYSGGETNAPRASVTCTVITQLVGSRHS